VTSQPARTAGAFPATVPAVLEVEGLHVDFPTTEGVVHAVRGLDIRLSPREVLGVVGESGSGKSVTALATMGLLPRNARTRGSIKVKGQEVLGAKEKSLMGMRGRTISMVFQDPMTSLNPVYSVGWQIAEALRAHQDIDKDEAMRRAVDLLTVVGIPNPAERAKEYPHAFSGGMRQRVVIAIAMANDPEIILADEPTTALDVTVQAQVLEALKRALTETHSALVLITHDLGVIAGLADRVVVMYAGRTVETAPVDEIFYRPAMPYTVGLLGSLPRLDRDGSERLRPIPGSPPSLLGEIGGCPFAPRCPMRVPEVCDVEEPPLRPAGSQAAGPHLSACHFADKVVNGTAGPIFAATSLDLTDKVAAADGAIRATS
jgi:oligopeptide/dipeptide ABC transporter ATP-binding protein